MSGPPKSIRETFGLGGRANGRANGQTPTPAALGERVMIGKMIREGIEPPVFLEPDILMEGAVHWLFGSSESGKTWIGLWLVKNRIEAGERVLYFDKENGPEIIGERLELLGCAPEAIDAHLVYRLEPDLKLDGATMESYADLLDTEDPALIVFDAARGFLTSAGLEENSNDDLDKFYEAVLKPVRVRKRTSVVLDHIPHDGDHARGAGRKKDLADVMWKVECPIPFDQDRAGMVKLKRRKGRRGALPETVAFSVGSGEAGFVLARSAETVKDEDRNGLTDSQRKVLNRIRENGPRGATWKELLESLNGAKSTLSRATNDLTRWNHITKCSHRYHIVGPVEPKSGEYTPNAGGSKRFQEGSTEPLEPGKSGHGSPGSTTHRGGTVEPFAGTPVHTPREGGVDALLADPPGWLAEQLGRLRREPERLFGPTAHSVRAALGDAATEAEVERELVRYLSENGICEESCKV